MTPLRISVGETQWFEITFSVCYSSNVIAGTEVCGAWMRSGHWEKFLEFFCWDKMSLMMWQKKKKTYINLANSLINKLMCDIIRAAWQSAILAQWATWLQTVSVSVKNWDCSNSHDTKGVDNEPNPLTIIQQQRHKCVYHSSLVPIINRWGAGGVTYIIICSDGQQQALATSSNKQG